MTNDPKPTANPALHEALFDLLETERFRRRLSQADMAKLLGMSPAAYGGGARGGRFTSTPVLAAAAEKLGCRWQVQLVKKEAS